MKIKRIESIAVGLPMLKPVKMSLEEVRSANNALARLETDDGVVGWGEAASAPTIPAMLTPTSRRQNAGKRKVMSPTRSRSGLPIRLKTRSARAGYATLWAAAC